MARPDKKAVDVAKPGKPAPDATARPVIVPRGPVVQDPMVKDTDEDNDDKTVTQTVAAHRDKVIAPLNKEGAVAADDTSEADSPDGAAPEEKAADEESTDTTKAEASEDAPDKEVGEKPASDEAAEVDAIAEQAESKKKEGELSKEEEAKKAALQKLVEQKKYFVPIGQVTRRRQNRQAFVILIVLLLAVGVYVALDAKLINNNLKLPINFIKN